MTTNPSAALRTIAREIPQPWADHLKSVAQQVEALEVELDRWCALYDKATSFAADETYRAETAETRLAEVTRIAGEALEPFAATGRVLEAKPSDDACWAGQRPAPPITFGHLRRAAQAHAKITGGANA